MSDDLDPLEQHLVDRLRSLEPVERAPEPPSEASTAWRAQVESRAIDHAARWLQSRRRGFYTIGSAGHESNALVDAQNAAADRANALLDQYNGLVAQYNAVVAEINSIAAALNENYNAISPTEIPLPSE